MGDAVCIAGDDQQAVGFEGGLDLWRLFLHHAMGQGQDDRLCAFEQVMEDVFFDTGMKARDDAEINRDAPPINGKYGERPYFLLLSP